MSGSGGSNPRPASRSPGGPRKKLDTDSRGRDKTKAPHNSKGSQSPGRSKSGARECWECHEVVTGDHFGHNCPKAKKKGDVKKMREQLQVPVGKVMPGFEELGDGKN